MKEFLFMYPIQEYLDEIIGRGNIRQLEGREVCQKFNDIVEARYRQREFRVGWVMFKDRLGKNVPDMLARAREINIKPDDDILFSDVDFCTHRLLKIYPDFANILAQLPQGLEKLVVGGFHYSDCVDKMAETAYRQGIPTIVDEDTTEVFFRAMNLSLGVPLVRDTFPPDPEMTGFFLQSARQNRSAKPWFTQF